MQHNDVDRNSLKAAPSSLFRMEAIVARQDAWLGRTVLSGRGHDMGLLMHKSDLATFTEEMDVKLRRFREESKEKYTAATNCPCCTSTAVTVPARGADTGEPPCHGALKWGLPQSV